jgi:hypothetical protein
MKNSMSVAYAMKKKRKKMAEGGDPQTVNSDPQQLQSVSDSFKKAVHSYAAGGVAGGSANRAKGAARVRNEEGQKGVHTSSSIYTPGESSMGYHSQESTNDPESYKSAGTRNLYGKEQKTKSHAQSAREEHEKVLAESRAMPDPKLKGLAEGGFVEDEMASGYESMPAEDSDDDLVMRIMKKRYSEGGKVANQDEEITGDMPNEFDVLHLDDDLESSYDGANSGDELGNDQEDEDRKDIVSRIMKSRAKKDRLPNPR